MGFLSRLIIGGGTVGAAWYEASSFAEYQGKKLETYYGADVYKANYARGVDLTKTGINIAAAYVGATTLFGRPITKGSAIRYPLGLGLPVRGVIGAGKGIGRGVGRSVARRFGPPLAARSRHRKALRVDKQLEGVGPFDWGAYAFRGERIAATREVERSRRIYDRAKKYMLKPRAPLSGRKRWSAGKLNPLNWSHRGMMATYGGAAVGGLAAGAYAFPRMNNFPIREAGNVQTFKPVAQRMNFSTVGLTQALHDRRNRTFQP